MPKYWMISLRNAGGTGTDRNRAGPTYRVSDNDAIEVISNWTKVTFEKFKAQLVQACSQFPDPPPEEHEEGKHVVLAVLRGVDRAVLVNKGIAPPNSWWPNKAV